MSKNEAENSREGSPAAVWPPQPQKPPQEPSPQPPSPRLLTGRNGWDWLLGLGLLWLWLFGVSKAASWGERAYISYVFSAPLSQRLMPDWVLWLGEGTFALLSLAGIYFGLRGFLPVMARSFGQSALLSLGMALIIGLLFKLFP